MESALSLLAKGFLSFSHDVIIVPLLVCGFLMQKEDISKGHPAGSPVWGNICLLVLFTMIFNAFLKSIFLIPLNPALGIAGFAFPSGHMQVSVVFYGGLFRSYPHRWVRGILLVILGGIGYGLIQQGYHTLIDVLAAVGMGMATLYAFEQASTLSFIQKNPAHLGLCLVPLTGLMMGVISHRTGIPAPTWQAFFMLIGFSISWFFCYRAVPNPASRKQTIIIFSIIVAFFLLVINVFDLFKFLPAGMVNAPWVLFFVATFLPVVWLLCIHLFNRNEIE